MSIPRALFAVFALFALSAAAIDVSFASQRRSSAVAPLAFLQRRESLQRVGVSDHTTWDHLMKSLVNNAYGDWPTVGKGKMALDVLTGLFEADNGDVDTLEHFRTKAHALNDNTALDTGNADETAVHEFITEIRKFAPKPADQSNAVSKLLIRGAGPAGLATALYAKQKPNEKSIKKVRIIEQYDEFTRWHMVNIKTTVSLSGGNDIGTVNIEGMSRLYKALGLHLLKKWFTFAQIDASSFVIPTSTMENALALAARIVGVEFEIRARHGAKGEGQKYPSEVMAGLAIAHDQAADDWPRKTSCTVSNTAGVDFSGGERGAYNVFVGAEGVHSPTRMIPMMKGSTDHDNEWVVLEPTSGTPQVQLVMTENSHRIKTAGRGMPVIAFVFDTNDCLDHVPGQAALGGDQISPKKLFVKPQQAQRDQLQSCMFEVPFLPVAGANLLSAFGDYCSWNYNKRSKRPLSGPEATALETKLRLAFRVFNAIWTNDKTTAAERVTDNLAVFKNHVVEIKVYTIDFRANTGSNDKSKVLAAKSTADDRRLAMLVGDAARSAFPDGGMGANDAHHSGKLAAELARDFNPENVGASDAKIGEFNDHATKVATVLQALKSVKDALKLNPENTALLNPGTAADNDVIIASRKHGGVTVLTQALTFKTGEHNFVHYPLGY